ncbi:hypothetical protein R1sor_022524 [Riccia sorocarpa]|uniref:Uncharacterized protein n=1 Tax=Riccia sorocarpa TaxID=122646 RepID=A0ABD3GKT0_9MARC
MELIIREPKPGGAITNIIHSVTWEFEDLPTPKIPLCRLVPFCRVRQFLTSSIQTEALKKSFETQCYMEHASAFHVSPFDENGEAMFVKQEDKDKWDTLWRMESDAFDAEMLKEPAYKELANRMFSTWDGNHRRGLVDQMARFGLRRVTIWVDSGRVASFGRCVGIVIVMVEHSRSTDHHEAIQKVLHKIPLSSSTEPGGDVESSLPTVALRIHVPPGSLQAAPVESTPAIPKPARGSQPKKATTPFVSNLSPPTTRSKATEKRSKDPQLEYVKENQVIGAQEIQSEPRRSL